VNGTRGLVIAVAAAFIVGCSVGLMGGILFMRFGPASPHLPHGPGAMGGGPPFFEGRGGPGHGEHMISMLGRELDLSPGQHERIVRQIDRARAQHGAARESMRVWIERELTPEQREKWRRMEERFERSRRGRGARVPRGPDRP
jgi:hypothetical protein